LDTTNVQEIGKIDSGRTFEVEGTGFKSKYLIELDEVPEEG
jgi:hypothetical protein